MVTVYARHTPAARMRSGVRRAWRVDEGTFKVFGRQGAVYLIPVVGGMPGSCPCPDRTGACWHRGLVAARLLREARQTQGAAVASASLPDDFSDIDWEALR